MRGPEADETKTMTVAWPHHACVPQHCQSGGSTIYYTAAPSSAFELCGCTRSALLATRRRHGVQVQELSRNSFADALFTQGLMALMQPIICCVRAQSAREFVTEFSGGATPHRSGVAQSSELATQAHPSQPHSRLMVSVHVGGRLADSG